MCLSTVVDQNRNTLCENVMKMSRNENGELVFTNIMGIRTAVLGKIEEIDLLDNQIRVWKLPANGAGDSCSPA